MTDCYEKKEEGEPTFTLLGRDRHAPTLLRQWAEMRRRENTESDEVLDEVLRKADAMEEFRAKRQKRPLGNVETSAASPKQELEE